MRDNIKSITKILCIGKKDFGGKKQDFVSKLEWAEIFKDYDRQAAYHVANLAAHNWDVALINNRCFIGSASTASSHWLDPDGTKTYLRAEELDTFYPKTPVNRIGWNGHVMNWDHGYSRQTDFVLPEED